MATSAKQIDPVTPPAPKSVEEPNSLILEDGPAIAVNNVRQISAHAIGLSLQNAVSCQHNMNQLYTAIVAEAINVLKKA